MMLVNRFTVWRSRWEEELLLFQAMCAPVSWALGSLETQRRMFQPHPTTTKAYVFQL